MKHVLTRSLASGALVACLITPGAFLMGCSTPAGTSATNSSTSEHSSAESATEKDSAAESEGTEVEEGATVGSETTKSDSGADKDSEAEVEDETADDSSKSQGEAATDSAVTTEVEAANDAVELEAANATETSAAAGKYVPGTYTGKGRGMGGAIEVTLTVDEDGIVSVDAIEDEGETQGIGGKEAIEDGTFAAQIMDAQSDEIDGITGATATTSGVETAVRNALKQASGE